MERIKLIPRVRADSLVYVIFRQSGVPCYVGKGLPGRELEHGKYGSHNRRLRRIYAKEGDLPVVVVREGLTDDEACALEIELIAVIGRHDLGRGPLVNMTDGGETTVGMVPSSETRRKISETLKGRPGRPQSDAWREMVGALHRGVPKSEEHRYHISLAMTSKRRSIQHREAQSRRQLELGICPPSPKGLRWYLTPEGECYRAREPRSPDDQVGRVLPKKSPEAFARASANISAALRGKKHSSERVERMKAGQRAALERKRQLVLADG